MLEEETEGRRRRRLRKQHSSCFCCFLKKKNEGKRSRSPILPLFLATCKNAGGGGLTVAAAVGGVVPKGALCADRHGIEDAPGVVVKASGGGVGLLQEAGPFGWSRHVHEERVAVWILVTKPLAARERIHRRVHLDDGVVVVHAGADFRLPAVLDEDEAIGGPRLLETLGALVATGAGAAAPSVAKLAVPAKVGNC